MSCFFELRISMNEKSNDEIFLNTKLRKISICRKITISTWNWIIATRNVFVWIIQWIEYEIEFVVELRIFLMKLKLYDLNERNWITTMISTIKIFFDDKFRLYWWFVNRKSKILKTMITIFLLNILKKLIAKIKIKINVFNLKKIFINQCEKFSSNVFEWNENWNWKTISITSKR